MNDSAPIAKEIRVPLMRPSLPTAAELHPYLEQIDRSQSYTNFGPLNDKLQRRLQAWYEEERGSPGIYFVTTGSGTSALEILIQSLSLSPSAKILVPALTFVATATAVLRLGFEPVACDIDPDTWLMTPESISGVDLAGVEAAIPVATFGAPQNAENWANWSGQTGRKVIIDAAAAFGGQMTAASVPVTFSMHATKPLSSAEGGLIMTSDASQAKFVRNATNFGLPDNQLGVGTNGKLSEYHAAVALASFENWDHTVSSRNRALRHYQKSLSEISGVALLPSINSAYCPSVAIARFISAELRNQCEVRFAQRGIETRRWYCPILTNHPVLNGRVGSAGELSEARRAESQILGLPFYTEISDSDIDYVLTVLKDSIHPTAETLHEKGESL